MRPHERCVATAVPDVGNGVAESLGAGFANDWRTAQPNTPHAPNEALMHPAMRSFLEKAWDFCADPRDVQLSVV